MTLLERDIPLALLDTALREAAGGVGRLALVSGEAGIGKTALVEQFTRTPRPGVRVLWGACDALFTPRPYGPVHDMAPALGGAVPALLVDPKRRAALYSTFLVELQNRPTIAVIEDLHWADESTLDLLRYLARRIERTATLLILTQRADGGAPADPFRALLAELDRNKDVVRLPLAPLSPTAVAALIAEHAPQPTRWDSARVHHQTGGNPFFVTEVIAGDGRVPVTVADAVLARVDEMGAAERRVLELAAVLGARVESDVLTRAAGADAVALDACLAHGLLTTTDDRLGFRHELVRQAIIDSLSPTRRMTLHASALAVLRAEPSVAADLTRLAHHAAGANDHGAILELAPAAARQAAALNAHRAAAELYKLALDVAGSLPVAEQAQLWEDYAREREHIEPRSEAVAARRRAASLWADAGDRHHLGDNLARVAMGLNEIAPKAECAEAIDAALAVLEALPPSPALMITYRTKALLALANADDDRAIALAEQALAVAEALGDPSVTGSALEGVGLCWLGRDLARACDYLERSLSLQRGAQAVFRCATVCANLGSVYSEQYRFADAERVLGEGIALAVEHDLDRLLAFMEGWRALMWMHQGRWSEAEELAEQSLQRAASGQIPALLTLGRIRARRGDPDAYATLNDVLAIGVKLGNLQRLSLQRAACAEGAWLVGDRARTRIEANELYTVALAKRNAWVAGELAYWRWRIGDDVFPLPEWLAPPFALQITGDWRAAAEAWAALGCPYEQARALADGDVDARLAALALFDRLGAAPDAAALREALKTAGIRRIPRGPRPTTRDNPFGLTARQAVILALLGEGLSNPEIAARLNVSPKTVENYVTALLRKLGVHTRQDAAEKARRTPPA